MESRRVGDRLDMVIGGDVAIVSRHRWKLDFAQTWYGLSEGVTEIRVFAVVAVLRPPTGVHGELHQVSEPSDLLGACRFTAWQVAKAIQIERIGTLGNQVGINECE